MNDDPKYNGKITSFAGPDLASKIVAAIEANLSDRRGISWDNIDDEPTVQAMRDELAAVVRGLLPDVHASRDRDVILSEVADAAGEST